MLGARTGGLDTQIRNRMMKNPMQLQQNYKQKGDILDLIALQMIKSEQDKKKKDLMLKMQRNPNTIKQQIEKAVMQQTKDDLVKQTSGILALKNAQQQKNLQRAASSKPRPPMTGIAQPLQKRTGRAPAMENPLAVGLAKAPAPNMRGMTQRAAQGGIVGFSTAGVIPKPEDLKKDASPFMIDYTTLQSNLSDALKSISGETGIGGQTKAGIEGALKGTTDDEFDARLKKAKEFFGITDAQKQEFKDLYQERKDIEKQQFDPEKLRQQELLNFLAGVAGATSLASAGERGIGAAAQTRQAAEQARLNQQKGKTDLFRNITSDLIQNQKDIFTTGETLEGRGTQVQIAGLGAGVNLTATELDNLNARTKTFLEADRANQTAFSKYVSDVINAQLQLHANAADNKTRTEIANLQAETEEKIRTMQMNLEDKRLKEGMTKDFVASLESTKKGYEAIMQSNNASVLGFYKDQLNTLRLSINAATDEEKPALETEYAALLETVRQGQNLLNASAIAAVADVDEKINQATNKFKIVP